MDSPVMVGDLALTSRGEWDATVVADGFHQEFWGRTPTVPGRHIPSVPPANPYATAPAPIGREYQAGNRPGLTGMAPHRRIPTTQRRIKGFTQAPSSVGRRRKDIHSFHRARARPNPACR